MSEVPLTPSVSLSSLSLSLPCPSSSSSSQKPLGLFRFLFASPLKFEILDPFQVTASARKILNATLDYSSLDSGKVVSLCLK